MKYFTFSATIALAMLSLSISRAAANALANPGFEDPVTMDGAPFVGFWEAFISAPGDASSSNDSAMPRTGTAHLNLSIFGANNAFAGVFQDVPGVMPGVTTTFRLWHKTTTDPFDVSTEIRIEWRNALDMEIARTPNSTPIPTDTYSQFVLRATPPAGTAVARVVYAIQSFGPEPTNNGTVLVDDASVVFGLVPGDFDDDGDVDVPDYLTLSSHLHTDVSGLTSEQSYLSGDMTRDLEINGRDFLAFVTAFDDANGVAAFQAMIVALPEPGGLGLAGIGLVVTAAIWRRAEFY